jgi:hypothetical protein
MGNVASILLAVAAGASKADVFNASVNEQVSESLFGGTLQGSDSNTTLPPVSMSVGGTAFAGTDQESTELASIAITYTGPTVAAPSTPGLELDATLLATAVGVFAPASSASFTYNFSLDVPQPYTYSTGFLAPVTFTGPGGTISGGSGELAAGDYSISTSAVGADNDGLTNNFFSLTIDSVPEPVSSVFFGMGFLSLAIRRRR